MKEIAFFLSYMFNRGEGGSLILILKVISGIHDMVNGMVLEANADVTSHITKLMSEGVRTSRHIFVCYACPASFVSLEAMTDHLNSISHRMAKMGNGNKECLR